jgi:hypothetical protein
VSENIFFIEKFFNSSAGLISRAPEAKRFASVFNFTYIACSPYSARSLSEIMSEIFVQIRGDFYLFFLLLAFGHQQI